MIDEQGILDSMTPDEREVVDKIIKNRKYLSNIRERIGAEILAEAPPWSVDKGAQLARKVQQKNDKLWDKAHEIFDRLQYLIVYEIICKEGE